MLWDLWRHWDRLSQPLLWLTLSSHWKGRATALAHSLSAHDFLTALLRPYNGDRGNKWCCVTAYAVVPCRAGKCPWVVLVDSLVLCDCPRCSCSSAGTHTWAPAPSVRVHSLSPLQAPAPGSWPLVRSSEGASLLLSTAFRPSFS